VDTHLLSIDITNNKVTALHTVEYSVDNANQ